MASTSGSLSPSVKAVVLIPDSNEFANEVYLQTLERTLPSTILVQVLRVPLGEGNASDTSVLIASDIECVIVTGLTRLVMCQDFLSKCQRLLGPGADGTRAPFTGTKLLLSQGFPAGATVDENILSALNMFDHLILRTKTDMQILTNSEDSETLVQRTQVWPDLPYLSNLNSNPSPANATSVAEEEEEAGKRLIIVYLPKSIATHNPAYKRLLKSLVGSVRDFISQALDAKQIVLQYIALGPCDIPIATDLLIYSSLAQIDCSDITVVNIDPSIEAVTAYFQSQKQTQPTSLISFDVAMTELAILATLPVISLRPANAQDNSMERLADDIGIDKAFIIEVRNSERYGRPEKIDAGKLTQALLNLDETSSSTLGQFPDTQIQCLAAILEILQNRNSSNGILVGPAPDDIEEGNNTDPSKVTALTTSQISVRAMTILKGVEAFYDHQKTYEPSTLALYICFKLTQKNEPSKYLHGLTNLLQTFNDFDVANVDDRLEKAIRWLVKDAFQKGLTYDFPSVPAPPAWLTHSSSSSFVHQSGFSISLDSVFRQPSYKGVHRSGWAYVVAGLAALHDDTTTTTFLDVYLDATFGWMEPVLVFEDILPYTKPWAGIIHHGYDNDELFDVKSLIAKESFQQSLSTCRCLITLSEDLREKVENGLREIVEATNPTLVVPPIITMVHPTEILPRSSQFSMEAFVANNNRRIVQVGAFYRNSFAIYALPLGEFCDPEDKEDQDTDKLLFPNTLDLQKCHLKAVDSVRYFKPNDLFTQLIGLDTDTTSEGGGGSVSRSISGTVAPVCRSISQGTSGTETQRETNNVYVQGLTRIARKMDNSVQVLDHLPNDEFDQLFTQNIIFLNLVDCSAANTICEAIVRNTPVLVNPLPAVVEALGFAYPFYYTSLTEAAEKANSLQTIEAAYWHLKGLDKSKYHLDYFLNEFQKQVSPFLPSKLRSGGKRGKVQSGSHIHKKRKFSK